MIWGEKTTTQAAIDMELKRGAFRGQLSDCDVTQGRQCCSYPQMPDIASTSRLRGPVGGAIVGGGALDTGMPEKKDRVMQK